MIFIKYFEFCFMMSKLSCRRKRKIFPADQREELEKAYDRDPYPHGSTIEELARKLNTTKERVRTWFNNHRSELRRNYSTLRQSLAPISQNWIISPSGSLDSWPSNQPPYGLSSHFNLLPPFPYGTFTRQYGYSMYEHTLQQLLAAYVRQQLPPTAGSYGTFTEPYTPSMHEQYLQILARMHRIQQFRQNFDCGSTPLGSGDLDDTNELNAAIDDKLDEDCTDRVGNKKDLDECMHSTVATLGEPKSSLHSEDQAIKQQHSTNISVGGCPDECDKNKTVISEPAETQVGETSV